MKPNQLPRAAVLAALGASAVLTACSAPAGGDTSFFDGTSAQPDAEEFGTRREALGARADVTATLSGPSTATPGAATSYTVLTRNIGTKNAASTQVVFTPPPGSSVTSLGAGCMLLSSPPRVRCSFSTLNAGASQTRNIGITFPNVSGTVTTTAVASTSSAEASTSNNSASLTTTLAPLVFEPELSLPQALFGTACYPATDFSQCTPTSWVTADLVLLDGGIVDTLTPDVSGTYTQPNGPSSLHMQFRMVADDSWLSTFTGQAVSTSCFRGTVSTASGPGAFEACLQ